MKILIVALMTFNALASVLPERTVTPPLDMFSKSNKLLKTGERQIKVTKVSKKGEFQKDGSKILISEEAYQNFLRLAYPVFQSVEDREGHAGTAFHIGNNLVLTNNHVLDVTFKNTSKCGEFKLKDHAERVFHCKTVHYCNPQDDVCLIEMKPIVKGKNEKRVEIGLGPSHKLKNDFRPSSDQELFTAVGNSAGFGIHLSQAPGHKFTRNNIIFYAPITKGNSGGALLNAEGLVVGVVKQQSQMVIGNNPDKVYNIALTSEETISLVREALKDNTEILEKFNQSVVE